MKQRVLLERLLKFAVQQIMHRPLTATTRAFVSRSHIKSTFGEHIALQGIVVAVKNNHCHHKNDDGNGCNNVE